jgi:hypothetical protein
MKKLLLLVMSLLFMSLPSWAQVTDDDDDDIDYGAVELAGGGSTKTYANSRIIGTTPQRFVSVGWDWQAPYDMTFSRIGSYDEGDNILDANQGIGRANYTGGFRLNANIPVISRNNLVWQMGATYWDTRYAISGISGDSSAMGVLNALNNRGLRTGGINTTIYKPLDEKQFILIQASADMSGDFGFGLQSELRYSVAALWGKRPNDRKQWAVGVVRTYRVGAMNYIPVYMYNWTAANRKWGIEALLPARGAIRYNIDRNSMLLAGFELEGQSYRLNSLSENLAAAGLTPGSLEIRRGEIRPRLEYMRQLTGYFWLGVQAGYRINYSYDADILPNGREFFRGFFGTQQFAMLNSIGNAPYAQITINFVSP